MRQVGLFQLMTCQHSGKETGQSGILQPRCLAVKHMFFCVLLISLANVALQIPQRLKWGFTSSGLNRIIGLTMELRWSMSFIKSEIPIP